MKAVPTHRGLLTSAALRVGRRVVHRTQAEAESIDHDCERGMTELWLFRDRDAKRGRLSKRVLHLGRATSAHLKTPRIHSRERLTTFFDI